VVTGGKTQTITQHTLHPKTQQRKGPVADPEMKREGENGEKSNNTVSDSGRGRK